MFNIKPPKELDEFTVEELAKLEIKNDLDELIRLLSRFIPYQRLITNKTSEKLSTKITNLERVKITLSESVLTIERNGQFRKIVQDCYRYYPLLSKQIRKELGAKK